MQLSILCRGFQRAVAMVQEAAAAIQADPALAQAAQAQLETLIQNVNTAERTLQQTLAKELQRPLPAPREDAVGAWVTEMERMQLPDVTLADSIPTIAQLKRIAGDAERLTDWARGARRAPAPAPQAAPTAGPGLQTAQAVMQATPPGRIIGICLMGLSTLATLGTAYAGYKAEQRRTRTYGRDPGELTPEEAADQAQRLIDGEIPGAAVRVHRTPTGEFIASVKRGSETLAREEARDPATAASDAVKAAVNQDAARSIDVDGAELVQPVRRARSHG